jgi:hypothetical protein
VRGATVVHQVRDRAAAVGREVDPLQVVQGGRRTDDRITREETGVRLCRRKRKQQRSNSEEQRGDCGRG